MQQSAHKERIHQVLPNNQVESVRYARLLTTASIAITSMLIITACGPSDEPVEPEPLSIRAPRATFTPTPQTGSGETTSNTASESAKEPVVQSVDGTDLTQNTAAESAATESGTGGSVTEPDAPQPAAVSPERVAVENGGVAVVGIQLLNGRSGPGAEYDLVGIVGKGEFFDITGRNDAGDWWEVCCYLDIPFWVADEFVNIQGGNTGQVASVPPTATPVPPTAVPPTAIPPTAVPQSAPVATSAGSQPAPAPPTATAAPVEEPADANFAFTLKATEQFPETNVSRIFLYVFNNDQALAGFSLKVTKDGADIAVNETSFGPTAGFTWSIESARQRFQNLKVEFPDQSPAGTWVVQLVDSDGNPAGPAATFTLEEGDENQEMYVRYEQK